MVQNVEPRPITSRILRLRNNNALAARPATADTESDLFRVRDRLRSFGGRVSIQPVAFPSTVLTEPLGTRGENYARHHRCSRTGPCLSSVCSPVSRRSPPFPIQSASPGVDTPGSSINVDGTAIRFGDAIFTTSGIEHVEVGTIGEGDSLALSGGEVDLHVPRSLVSVSISGSGKTHLKASGGVLCADSLMIADSGQMDLGDSDLVLCHTMILGFNESF